MVFYESVGDNDFRSLYKSVDEEMSEAEERKQTEMMLRVLDDLDARITTKEKHNKKKSRRSKYKKRNHYDSDDTDSGSDSEDEYIKRPRRTIGRPYKPVKELMRVSIVDDEKARQEQIKEDNRRENLHGKVHTLDDLPRDELDFGSFFGSPATPEPEINIQAGRRLMDGKVFYSASFPGFLDGFELENIDFQIEYAIIFILVVFLVGIYIGKKASNRRNARVITQMRQKHSAQLQSMERNLMMSGYGRMQNPNPVYIPVPMQTQKPPQSIQQSEVTKCQKV